MLTGKEDLLQALMDAFLMEKGTMEFYGLAAQKAIAKEAREAFKSLSAWEERHMDFIQFLYQAIQEDRDIRGFEEFKAGSRAPFAEGGVPLEDLVAKLEYNFTDDLGAIITALEIEGKAYALYHRLSQSASDTNAQVVFKDMMEQEAGHINYLKEARRKIEETS